MARYVLCFIYATINIGIILRKDVTPQNHNYVWMLLVGVQRLAFRVVFAVA